MSDRKSRVFGPVPSRRLGRSLGVDLVPFKTCSYDCIYCQLGRTTCLTTERREWVPTDEIIEDIKAKACDTPAPDYITFSGSGEPTLHSGLGRILDFIRSETDIPIAVLTNGSLLWMPEVCEAVAGADLVVPSLDAGDAETFEIINRPAPGIDFEDMVRGLRELAAARKGEMWLEVFLAGGVNTGEAQLEDMARIARGIGPDRIQLNTVVRPPAEEFAKVVSCEEMERIVAVFGPKAEVVADYRGTHEKGEFAARREHVMDLLGRRPCTVDDIAAGLAMHVNEVVKYVDELARLGSIKTEDRNGKTFYFAADAPGEV